MPTSQPPSTSCEVRHVAPQNEGAPPPRNPNHVGLDARFDGLPTGLIEDLADLYVVPSAAVDAILQTLPFGYRAALEGLEYLSSDGPDSPVALTPSGRQLLARAHDAIHHQLVDQGPPLDVLRQELRTSMERLAAIRPHRATEGVSRKRVRTPGTIPL
jgi:hypothetical protein